MAYDAENFPITTAPAKVDPLSLTTPRERLEYLRDFLRELPAERFDMTVWGEPECGTAGCIGGWTDSLWGTRDKGIAETGEVLGLSLGTADRLFFPWGIIGELRNGRRAMSASPQQAADVLDHLIQTGEVDWSVARTEAA